MPTLPTRATGEASFVEDAAAFPLHPPSGPERLRAVLNALLRDPDELAEWLRALDPVAVAGRSCWHHNGFAKLVLHEGPDFRVRLHVWPPGEDRAGESNPHGHRWDFASTVLCGTGLAATSWLERDEGRSFVRHDYVGKGTSGNLTRPCNTRLEACDTTHIRTHERYLVTTEAIHTIAPLGRSLVATLLVQGPARQASTMVYCAPGTNTDQPGLAISGTEVREVLALLLAAPDTPWEA